MGYGEIVRNDYSTRRDWAIWTYTTARSFTKGSAFRTGPRLGNVHRGCFWQANQRQWKVCCETVRLVKTLGKIMKKQSIVGYSIRWSTNAGFRYNEWFRKIMFAQHNRLAGFDLEASKASCGDCIERRDDLLCSFSAVDQRANLGGVVSKIGTPKSHGLKFQAHFLYFLLLHWP